ncbi:unnamed protein product [Arctia plantaginis]|uniref:UDP-glucuronosyltransferase n=1 Tax=Arctia plantaginis TaxID=874455 RepID=A0A8S1A1Z1_ARCPL|nr:unnamed protein product [Arctia plantaginis]
MFINSHPSIGGAMKLPQNAINIAGYHIQDKVKPLPKNLQTIMDKAKNGVIYFSLGSNMKSDGMSEEMKQSLIKMFSKLDQTVIWKFESDTEISAPNVHFVKWAPQPSILAHPNLKVFITHGGQLSTTEAVHFGVPLVGIPIMADQHVNMGSVERKGFGIKVTLAEDMADELNAAIRQVLSDETFKAKAKEVSAIFHDRPMKPGPALAYWVEHVSRFLVFDLNCLSNTVFIMVLTLYKMDASPPVRAVYMVIEALNIPDVNYVELNLLEDEHLKEDFLKLNPQHTIPHLTDGDFNIWDSHAIITYLVNKFNRGSSFYPMDPEKRARIDLMLHFDSGILYPALRTNDEPVFFGKATSFTPEGLAKIESAYDFTEKFLNGVQWLAGDEPTLADISCVANISTLNELLPIDENVYPNVVAWLKRCSELDYYKKGNEPGLLEFRKLLKLFLARKF